MRDAIPSMQQAKVQTRTLHLMETEGAWRQEIAA
jgi:hypothetical protein